MHFILVKFGGIQKVRSLEIHNFRPSTPSCSSLFALHVLPSPSVYVRFRELRPFPLQKKVPRLLLIFQ